MRVAMRWMLCGALLRHGCGLRVPGRPLPASASLSSAHEASCLKFYAVPRTGSSHADEPLRACAPLQYYSHFTAMEDVRSGGAGRCGGAARTGRTARTVTVLRDAVERFRSAYWKRVTINGSLTDHALSEDESDALSLNRDAQSFKARYPTMRRLLDELLRRYPRGLPRRAPGGARADVLHLSLRSSHNVIFWPTTWFYDNATALPICYSRDRLYDDLERVTRSQLCGQSEKLWKQAKRKKPNAHFPANGTGYPPMSRQERAAVRRLYRHDVALSRRHACVASPSA